MYLYQRGIRLHYESGCLSHVYLSLGEPHPTATTLTLRGFGKSDQPPRGYSINTFAADVAHAIPQIAEPPVTLLVPNRNVENIALMVQSKHPNLVQDVVNEHPGAVFLDVRSPAARVLTAALAKKAR